MRISDEFYAVNIREYLALGDDPKVGEPALIRLLSSFSCPRNPDVERFLKKSAIEFTKKNQSVTYVVISVKDGGLLGYFSLAIKPLTVRGETVAFLEAENKEKLLSFYHDNRFLQFDTRQNTLDADEPHELAQLLRLLS